MCAWKSQGSIFFIVGTRTCTKVMVETHGIPVSNMSLKCKVLCGWIQLMVSYCRMLDILSTDSSLLEVSIYL